MLAIERRNAILEKLQVERRVVVSELSALYDVSEETIRRDLDKLENDGYAIKSYGGAVINENSNLDLPYNVRKNTNVLGKQKIASLIGEMMTVITNSLEIALELLETPGCNVISTGGLATGSSFALVGSVTDKTIRSYYVDKAIISCKGINMYAGFTESDERHANNKASMFYMAKTKILAIDSSKFNKIAFAKIGDLREISRIVTDKKPEEEWLQKFEELGVECIFPE